MLASPHACARVSHDATEPCRGVLVGRAAAGLGLDRAAWHDGRFCPAVCDWGATSLLWCQGHAYRGCVARAQAQEISLNFHCKCEQFVHFATGSFFNFNGTAGVCPLRRVPVPRPPRPAWCMAGFGAAALARARRACEAVLTRHSPPLCLRALRGCALACAAHVPAQPQRTPPQKQALATDTGSQAHALAPPAQERTGGSAAQLVANSAWRAGVWRRKTIQTVGGWQSRTTVEDMDLSLRAYVNGWKAIYLTDTTCTNEARPPRACSAWGAQAAVPSDGGAAVHEHGARLGRRQRGMLPHANAQACAGCVRGVRASAAVRAQSCRALGSEPGRRCGPG